MRSGLNIGLASSVRIGADAQTSIMAVQFEGGVVIGADSRTTTGSYIVSTYPFDTGIDADLSLAVYTINSHTLYLAFATTLNAQPLLYSSSLSRFVNTSTALPPTGQPSYRQTHTYSR